MGHAPSPRQRSALSQLLTDHVPLRCAPAITPPTTATTATADRVLSRDGLNVGTAEVSMAWQRQQLMTGKAGHRRRPGAAQGRHGAAAYPATQINADFVRSGGPVQDYTGRVRKR